MVCGEGPHDVGRIDQWSIKSKTMTVQEGWLQPLIRKYVSDDVEFEIVPRARLVKLPGPPKAPLPQGHGTKAFLAKFRAQSSACDVVIFMLDADTSDDAIWAQKVEEVRAGFDRVNGESVAIACIPKSASESWLLADEMAWKKITATEVTLPRDPENLWGRRDDPRGDHPHRCFAKTCDEAGLEDCTDVRRQLMEASSLDALKAKCPVSFGAFDTDVARLT